MLNIEIPAIEVFDERINEFSILKGQTLSLEHSLISLSKWESIHNKPFLTKEHKTNEEVIDYIRCMVISLRDVEDILFYHIPQKEMDRINTYIEAPMTATKLPKSNSINRETITSELIYFWMITLNIPFQCEKWHLNRLLILINVCNIKNQPAKKMNRQDLLNHYRDLNASRLKQLNTTG